MSLFPHFPIEDYRAHQQDLDAAVLRVLSAGNYILGGEVAAFEEEFAVYCGTPCAVGVANGTDAIELILRGLGIGPGDRVAVPSHTAVASASAVFRAGAGVEFIDVDAETFTMCPESLARLLDSEAGAKVKAVLAVHLYGHPCDMGRLAEIAGRHGVALVEDCAQAHGARWEGRPVGSLARAAAFSFYPTKNLGAVGDAGAITTGDEELAARIRSLRQYGWVRRYISDCEGVNSRLDEMQAAILRVKLRSLPERLERRRALAEIYARSISGLPEMVIPQVRPGCDHAWHLYVLRSVRRDSLMAYLMAAGVPVALHYPAAIHQQPGYQAMANAIRPLPVTEALVREILTLPLHPYLSEAAILRVAELITAFVDQPAESISDPQLSRADA